MGDCFFLCFVILEFGLLFCRALWESCGEPFPEKFVFASADHGARDNPDLSDRKEILY